MVIKLYSGFAKKNNSTKRPANNQTSVDVTGTLKDECSIMDPVFTIEPLMANVAPYGFTYAYISDFNRYYFVNNWVWNFGVWECSMHVDVLASFRTQIGNLSEYILRTDSDNTGVYNPWICDTLYPCTSYFTKVNTTIPSDPFAAAFVHGVAAGCYIVGIISGDTADSVGAVTYYAFTSDQFGKLKDILFSNTNLIVMGLAQSDGQGGIEALTTDMSLETMKTMYNPYQYIASCMWFPFAVSDIDDKSAVTWFKMGWWNYTIPNETIYRLTAQVWTTGQHTAVPSHPYSATRGYYLNYSPYTRRMFIGRFGCVPIDCSYIGANDYIHVSYAVDLITGQCRVDIGVYDNTLQEAPIYRITQREFLLGVPIQLAQIGVDYLGAAVTAVDAASKTVGNFLSFNPTGAISSAAHGIYDTLSATMPQLETGGSNGSFLTAYNGCLILSEFFLPVDEDIHHRGRPVCATRTINTLSGYVLCAEGDFDISCFESERDAIRGYLTGGFFWE